MDCDAGSAQVIGELALETDGKLGLHFRAAIAQCGKRDQSFLRAAAQIA